MGTYWSIPLIALAVVLQATFIPQIRILGGEPDLVFLLVLSWSINGRLEQGVDLGVRRRHRAGFALRRADRGIGARA